MGHFELIPKQERKGKKWRLQHAECAIIHRKPPLYKKKELTNA
ncbi:MAG TPA: hypothetical protein VN704_04765 [Verrucomicrobiae bacterium]|nr:hypothetical protein [Verrucomicrobiae bacterium]